MFVSLVKNAFDNYNNGNTSNINKKFESSKKYGIYFTDEKAKMWIKYDNMKNKVDFGFGFKGLNIDIDTLLVTDVSTILRVKDGYAYAVNQNNPKEKIKIPYTYFDAMADGSIKFSGDGSTNDIKILIDIFKENPNILKEILK
jgi:hypothetical protein